MLLRRPFLLFALLLTNAVAADVAPPVLTMYFAVESIPLNVGPSEGLFAPAGIFFEVRNPNATTTLTGVGFTDALPAGLILAIPRFGDTCGLGAITATPGTSVISLSGAVLPPNSSCGFMRYVYGTSAGQKTNVTGNVTSTESGMGAGASASITVVAPPILSMSFSPNTVTLTGTSRLTFTITNPGVNSVAQTGVVLVDNMPSELVIASPQGVTNSCGGSIFNAFSGSSSFGFDGGNVPVGGSCTFGLNVVGLATGTFTNVSNPVSSINGGIGNSASASLSVLAPPISVTGAFGASSIPLNGTTSLTLLISQNAGAVQNGVSFSDSLPAGLVVATPAGLSNTCGGTATALAGSGSFSLSGGTLQPNGACSVSVSVRGITTGIKNNSVQVSSSTGGASVPSTASLIVLVAPVLTKTFGSASIPLNGSTTLRFDIANSNQAAAATYSGLSFTDSLPAGLVVGPFNGLIGSCGGPITAPVGATTISFSGGNALPFTGCTFTVNVTGTTPGLKHNTTSSVTSNEGGTGGPASATIEVVAPPSIGATFNPSNIALNAAATLSFTIANPGGNTATLSGVGFSASLPTGLTVASGSTTACGGALTTTAPTGISLSGGSIAAGSQCQLSVSVTGAAAGNYTTTTTNVSSSNGGSGNSASASLSVGTLFTVGTSPAGLAFTVDNASYTSTQTFNWVPGSTHTIGTSSPQNVAPGTRRVFDSWSDSGAISHSVTAPSAATTYTASFHLEYQLTTSVNPSNAGSISPPTGFFLADSLVPVATTSNAGFAFQSWQGPVTSASDASTTVRMSGPAIVTATYSARQTQTITITPIPDKIFGDPPFTVIANASSGLPVTLGILSGPATISANTITLTGTGQVIVIATQQGNATFLQASAQARFNVNPASVGLTLSVSPPQGGSITVSPASLNGVYPSGTTVQIQAQANPGFVFIGFSGDLTGTTNPQSLLMNTPHSITANFTTPTDQLVFGTIPGFVTPPDQFLQLSNTVANGDANTAAGSEAVAVIPGTGGNWLAATLDSVQNPTRVRLSINMPLANNMATGTYVAYALLTSATGGTRLVLATLFVNSASISQILNSAGYQPPPMASEALFTLEGVNEANVTAITPGLPLGTTLGSTSVTIQDGIGVTRPAFMVYVSPGQVNLVTPAGMAPGAGIITLTNGVGAQTTSAVQIGSVSPGIFAADASGAGLAAAVVLKVHADGTSETALAANCATAACTPVPIDVSQPTVQVFLSLYGTGIRGHAGLAGVSVTAGGTPLQVSFAGAQPDYPGLDQINVPLPASLAGRGSITLRTVVDGRAANDVTITIR